MKRAMVALLFILTVCATTAQAEEPGLRLEIRPSQQTLRLGQQMQVQLKIAGPDLNRVIADTEGATMTIEQAQGFTCNMTFKPDGEGAFVLGPYKLTFNGVALESNAVTIQVLPEMGDVVGTFFRVDKTKIAQGESFELVVETRTKTEGPLTGQANEKMPKVRMKRDPNHSYDLSVGPMKIAGSTQGRTGSATSLTTRIYTVTPKEPGPFHIRRDFFEGIPEDCNDPNITVIVYPDREPATD